MTIYIDIVLLENIFMNYIIISATSIILKKQIRLFRFILSSTIGSIYAVFSYVSNTQVYSSLILKILLSISMIYIAFNPKNIKVLLKELMIFYLTSFTFGGVSFSFIYFLKPQNILIQNGVLIGTYPIKIIIAGGIVGFIVITLSFKTIKAKISRKDIYCTINIKINEKKTSTKAIIDTGNFLKDPISKLPVIVVQKDVLKECVPQNILDNLENIITGKDIDLGEFSPRIRFIPFNSLGKENGILLGIKAEDVEIEKDGIDSIIKNVIVGVYNGILSKSEKYYALVNLEILEGSIENEYTRIIKNKV